MTSEPLILEVENLGKTYGAVEAVRGISFSMRSGEIVGLLGPNGAGKTTTIDMILGIVEPSKGKIAVFGQEFALHRRQILAKMNFAAVYAALPNNLTVGENLFIFSLLYDIPDARRRVAELVEEFDLGKFVNTKSGLLSSGEQSRLHLAKAFLNKPRLLLMDEPTASVDPSISRMIREKVKAYARDAGAAILWTSHDMHEIEEVCNRVLFISHGRILLEGDPKELPGQHGKKDLEDLFIAVAREPLSLIHQHNKGSSGQSPEVLLGTSFARTMRAERRAVLNLCCLRSLGNEKPCFSFRSLAWQ